MTNHESELETEFFLTGARTYLDVQDALEEFEGQVTSRCSTVVKNRFQEIDDACGGGFWEINDLKDNIQSDGSSATRKRLGKQLPSGRRCSLYLSLELARAKEGVACRSLVHLRRDNSEIASDLWNRAALRDNNRIYFERPLAEDQIPDFDKHLNEAVSDFIAFVEKAGGLAKYFPPRA